MQIFIATYILMYDDFLWSTTIGILLLKHKDGDNRVAWVITCSLESRSLFLDPCKSWDSLTGTNFRDSGFTVEAATFGLLSSFVSFVFWAVLASASGLSFLRFARDSFFSGSSTGSSRLRFAGCSDGSSLTTSFTGVSLIAFFPTVAALSTMAVLSTVATLSVGTGIAEPV